MSTSKRKYLQQDDVVDFRDHGTRFDPSEDKCRHEFGPDTHLPTLLARFPRMDPLNPQRFGVQDFTGDLTTKFELQRNAERLYAEMPESLRAKYPTWRTFWAALDRGELEVVPSKAPAPTEVPSGGDGASASDSAPVPPAK